MDQATGDGNDLRPGDRITIVLEQGSPLPAGEYEVVDVMTGQGETEYRVRDRDNGMHLVRHSDLQQFEKVLR